MILDSHTHIGKKTIIASAQDLIKSMDAAHIDASLVFAGKINDQATQALLEDIAPFKGRLFGIGSISPLGEGGLAPNGRLYQYIREMLATNQIFGLKFYVGYEHYYPYDKDLSYIYELLIKYDRPAIFHSGDCYNGVCGAKLKYAHPLNIDELAVDYPALKIIIAHMGYPWVRDAAEVCYKNKNVYSDLSGFVYGDFKHNDAHNYHDFVVEFIKVAGGTNKLIFGTDWPISNQSSYITTLKDVLSAIGSSRQERAEIMGNRAAKLFGIV
jgi:predicted TIM-barrel fold metal-dependent hydrolase